MMTANNGKDYINRYAVLNVINDAIAHNALSYDGCVNEIMEFIAKIPAADVRPVVRGEWEEVEIVWLADIEEQPDAIASMFCPKCKRFANHVYHYGDPTHGMNFCPNCGADMRKES